MRYYRKMKFNQHELAELVEQMDGYIWCTVDARCGILSAGDDFMPDMRDDLIIRRSKIEDIFGFGLNLRTGEIDYRVGINRRNPTVGCKGVIPPERKERIETLVHYFFDGLAPYVAERNRPRYSRKPVDMQFTN